MPKNGIIKSIDPTTQLGQILETDHEITIEFDSGDLDNEPVQPGDRVTFETITVPFAGTTLAIRIKKA